MTETNKEHGQMTEELIMDTDDRAAKKVTVTGWLSRDGRFYGDDERIARYAGCTHRACEDCGEPAPKSYIVCNSCRDKRAWARWREYPSKAWDGSGMVFSDACDEFFQDVDQLFDYCYDNKLTPDDLRLVHCEPRYARWIDSDYFYDDLPEDGDIPDELCRAMDAFNEAAKKAPALSYWPAKVRATVIGYETAQD